ncbi:hypothetical protein OGAPHI_005332 [Ogataea philodendri]|uniref:Uncharacterized protein n=1 Tax=Ogataea philodendri TaxID=1378263 RepID=A0A9P8P207_9ASCO|nr:uncharacterized protein OGAPHI_005332 [Ogataea philodendri]KAH3663342.1 hypothetical protein OGAPHI_005332 [Ogataea philodendri]
MLDCKFSASKSGEKIDLGVIEQVLALSSEQWMFLLVNHENNVTRNDVWLLVTFSRENDSLTSLHSWIDVNLQDLSLVNDLLTLTGLTSVLWRDDVSFSVTNLTSGLESLDHRTHLSGDELHSHTVTGRTLLHVLSTFTFTGSTKHGLVQSQLCGLSFVQLLQSAGDGVLDIFAPLWSRRASLAAKATKSTKELTENVCSVHASHSSRSSSGEALLTKLVVSVSLIWIAQDLVCRRHFLERLGSLWRRVFIWVVFQGS